MRSFLAAALLVSAVSAGAQEAAREAPPAPGKPRAVTLPKAVEKTLANGLRVIVVPKHDIPLVATRLMVRTGAAADPQGREGLASLTAAVLTQGTKSRSAEEIARGIEALGATLDSAASWDSSSIDVSVMSTNLEPALGYVADVARNATFAKDELERERAQAVDAVQLSLSQPRALAAAVLARVIYGAGAYGSNLEGTESSLGRLSREDLIRFHAAHYRAANAVLLFAGDITAEAAFALAEKLFGSWQRGSAAAVAPAVNAGASEPRVVVVDMPEAGQAAVVVGRQGISRTDPGYFRALVANSVLGGGYSSRLNQEIRIRRGLSYGAGSAFRMRVQPGPFTAAAETKNESAPEVVAIILDEIGRLATSEVAAAELVPRKAVLIGEFAQSLEKTSGIVDQLSVLALNGLSPGEINRYIQGVEAVTAAEVRESAKAKMTGTHVVIVGDAAKFIEPLRERYPDTEVIPAGDVDLASPALRVRKAKE